MPKYYYDCPIEAAYMADKFSVNFGYDYPEDKNVKFPIYCEYSQEIDYLEGGFICTSHLHENIPVSKFHVHPDSEHIYKPKEGDLIQVKFSSPAGMPDGCNGIITDVIKLDESFDEFLESCQFDYEDRKILERNSKPFIWPKEVNHD